MVLKATHRNKGRDDRKSEASNKRVEAVSPAETKWNSINDISRKLPEAVNANAY